jgi:hypothetical protein
MKRAKTLWLRWIGWLSCLVLVVCTALVAFPRLWGSDDEPNYALAAFFLAQAVFPGIILFASRSPDTLDK